MCPTQWSTAGPGPTTYPPTPTSHTTHPHVHTWTAEPTRRYVRASVYRHRHTHRCRRRRAGRVGRSRTPTARELRRETTRAGQPEKRVRGQRHRRCPLNISRLSEPAINQPTADHVRVDDERRSAAVPTVPLTVCVTSAVMIHWPPFGPPTLSGSSTRGSLGRLVRWRAGSNLAPPLIRFVPGGQVRMIWLLPASVSVLPSLPGPAWTA